MYQAAYIDAKLATKNLSRVIEDSGTLSSPLIPWNTCGAYMAGALLISPFDYWYYAFFNLINPILAIAFALLGIKVLKKQVATA